MEPSINPLLSAREAIALLGIKRETLYAYVSRGLVRSVPGDGTARGRRYFKSDLERLKARHDARAGHAAVAGAALRWGEPVLDSAITRIDAELGPVYRGEAATTLVERDTPFEAVAARLWGAERVERFVADGPGLPVRTVAPLVEGAPLPMLAAVVPLLATRDPARFQAPESAELPRARALIARMVAALALRDRRRVDRALAAASLARALAIALGSQARESERAIADSPKARRVSAIDAALVLCADHELNPSTFAARVAASSGADLYACISAALATLSGPRHGGVCDRIEAMLAEAGEPARAAKIVRERARRGEAIPGFGHPLYAKGDPRASPLLDAAQSLAPKADTVRTVMAVVRAMRDEGRELPTLDLGLVALSGALGFPPGSAVALFAIGRTAGWIAHVLEQRKADFVLRPRARYVGI